MKFSSRINIRKILIMLGAVIFLTALSYYYFIQVVPKRKQELTQRGFRILARMDQNIKEKRNNILFTLDTIYSREPGDSKSERTTFDGLESFEIVSIKDWKDKYDSAQVSAGYDQYINKWSLRFFGNYRPWDNVKERYTSTSLDSLVKYDYDVIKFFSDILQYRNDFFEDYIVIDGTSIIYQTKDFSHEAKGFESGNRLKSDFVAVDTLSGQPYFVFYHPIEHNADTDFVICGLISVDAFNNYKHSISSDKVIWIISIFLIVLFSLPFIKLIIVSPFERITYNDVIKMCVCLIAGSAVFTTAFLLLVLSAAETKRQRSMLESVNVTIVSRISEELKAASLEIAAQERLMKTPAYKEWLKSNMLADITLATDKLDLFFNTSSSPHHTGAFQFIDAYGLNWASWMKNCTLYPDVELSDSEFPSLNPVNKQYRFTTDAEYGFQLINAWSGQRNSILISKLANDSSKLIVEKIANSFPENKRFDLDMVALETKLFCLTEVAIPSEIQFAILGPDGNVLFHSESKRNLRENFIEECNNRPLVKEAIKSRMNTTLAIQYFGNAYESYFSSIPGLPLTVVTLYDSTTYLDSIINEATFTLIMLFMLGALIIVMFFLAMLLTRRPKLLKRQAINMKWIRLTQLNRDTFRLLVITLSFIIVIGVVLAFLMSVKIFLAFTVPLMTLGLSGACIYAGNEQRYKKSLYREFIVRQFRTFFGLCIGIQCIYISIALGGGGYQYEGQIWIFGGICLSILLILCIRPNTMQVFRPRVQSADRLQGSAELKPKAYSATRNLLEFFRQLGAPQPNLKGTEYIVTAIILLILNISIYPTSIFFFNACSQEFQIVEKRNAMHLAESIYKRQLWLTSNFQNFILEQEELKEPDNTRVLRSGIYTLKNLRSDFQLMPHKEIGDRLSKHKRSLGTTEDRSELVRKLYGRIVNILNFNWDEREARDIFTHRDNADDPTRPWTWISNPPDPDRRWWWYSSTPPRELLYQYSSEFPSVVFAGVSVKLNMYDHYFRSIPRIDWLCFFVLLAGIVFTVYKILFYTYKKITLLDYFNSTTTAKIKSADQDLMKTLVNVRDGSNLIIIALPGTDVVKKLTTCLTGFSIVDNIPDSDPPKSLMITSINYTSKTDNVKVTILPFFDLSPAEDLTLLLNELSSLFQDVNRKVIWITSVNPTEQMEELRKRINELDKQAASSDDAIKLRLNREHLLRILYDFKKVTYRLEDNLASPDAPRTLFNSHIENEFRFGVYFEKLRNAVVASGLIYGFYEKKINQDQDANDTPPGSPPEPRERDENKIDLETSGSPQPEIGRNIDDHSDDLFVLKIQDIAHNYYISLWTTLNSKEKYVLYDLALDELTNYKNYPILVDLERKGILYFDENENTLKIFNKSFRNFILTVVDPEDAMMLKQEISTGETWDVFRTIMIIFVIAVGTFLFITEEWFFNELAVILAAVTVFAPAVVNFFTNGIRSIFPSKEK